MSRKILFFINPISGTKSKLQLEKKIIKKCDKENIFFEILFTSREGNYNFLPDKIKEENITDIVICGGDGSISPIVSFVLNIPVNIGIIPLGSGNGLARTAGIPNSVDRAMEIVIAGKASYIDAFYINNRLSVHVCGLGLDAKVAHDFAKLKKRGLHSYTKLAFKDFFSARAYPFILKMDDNCITVKAFLFCIANSNQFGNNFKIAPKASICDGLLDIVIIKNTTKAKAVFAFVNQILFGKIRRMEKEYFKKNNNLYFQTTAIKIENPQLALLHIDGDPAETSKDFLIEIIPSAYRLIQP
jgi:YegS/Rv2252/BmrU family lipid kinase